MISIFFYESDLNICKPKFSIMTSLGSSTLKQSRHLFPTKIMGSIDRNFKVASPLWVNMYFVYFCWSFFCKVYRDCILGQSYPRFTSMSSNTSLNINFGQITPGSLSIHPNTCPCCSIAESSPLIEPLPAIISSVARVRPYPPLLLPR